MNWMGWLDSLNDAKAGIDAEKCVRRIGAALFLLLIIVGGSWAGSWDFNPHQEAVKHRNDVTSDVQGTGYVREYMKVETNNLSLQELAHGSGRLDFAEILYDEQKTTPTTCYIYWIDYTTGLWKRGYPGASSAITYSRQYDNVQSPTSFAYGTGWYAAHPVTYNSLLKDKSQAKSYQESASMQRKVEYARGLKGDIAVDLNCTAPTATTSGTGSIGMRLEDQVTQGTLHVGELLALPMMNATMPKYKLKQGWKKPIIEIDADYIGDFYVQKTMNLDITKSSPMWGADWLPCCHGGFFDLPSHNFDREYASQKGIFDCTCRNISLSTMKPKWNSTMAQFPAEEYRYLQ